MIKQNREIRKSACILFLAVACLAFLWGCEKRDEIEGRQGDQVVAEAKPDLAVLQKTALAYWTDRLITRDYQASYALESKIGLPSFEEYAKLVSRNENFTFSALKTENAEMVKDAGTVDISLMAKGPGMPAAFDRRFKDKWSFSPPVGWRHQFSKNQP